ncbi:MAG: ABC transporter ATP-binding protein, partial [Deltaproteobacteria bacterium]|nr:ABC transporter ATP-binding protein [Deltaproteobacteria bacterium]
MFLIEVHNAAFSYGKQDIFQGISFEVSRGEIFCLLGPNGSGKTTLLDCVLGTNRLKSGNIKVNGENIASYNPRQLARQISYVPQRHECAFPYRVIDVTLMGRAAYTGIFSAPSKSDREIARKALRLTGIYHLRRRPYTQLSGGELQLVMLARALAQNTSLIVMDEPTAHLDFRHELVVLETIMNLVKEKEISILMATHFPNHAFYFEDNNLKINIALLKDGRFIAKGAPGEILNEETIEELYGVK